MTTHTRIDLQLSEYECAMGDCAHDVRPCPSWTEDVCKECTDRSWDEHEGPAVTWEECGGTGAIWDEDFWTCRDCGKESEDGEPDSHICWGAQPIDQDQPNGSEA